MKEVKTRRLTSLGMAAGAVLAMGFAESAQGAEIPCAGRAKAVIANTGQTTHNSASLVDSYQSSVGPYGGANIRAHGDVQAAGKVQMNGGVINGAVVQYTPAGLPVVAAPAGAVDLGWFNVNTTVPLTAGDYKANGININSGGTLTVTGGQVRIWVSGYVNINASANPGGVPKNLEILITGATGANINTNGRLNGLLYAPLGQVNVNDTVFGSVVGSGVTLNSGGKVHYDEDSACGTSCPPGQMACGGICTSTQSDAKNCGACWNTCGLGWACEMGNCIPPSSCLPANAPAAVVSGTDVFVYESRGSWNELATGIKRFQVEPVGSPSAVTIPTPSTMNSCAANPLTKTVACAENGDYVDLIEPSGGIPGTAITATLLDGATATQSFSLGSPFTAGIAVDPLNDLGVVAVGLSPGNQGGFQLLHLTPWIFEPVIPAPPGLMTSEGILIDPLRQLVLSPNEQNHYVLVGTTTSSVFDMPVTLPLGGMMDSAAEDCSTGIALASVENTGQIVLANLNGATYAPGTWTAPYVVMNLPELGPPWLSHGVTGIAVDSRTHLGVVTGEFGGSGFGVFSLPATPPDSTTAPAIVDYVRARIPVQPDGQPWAMGGSPHPVTLYTSPSTGKVYAVLANQARTFVAVVDLQAALAAPRWAAHVAAPLAPGSVVRLVQ